mmetsp:Transcript_13411/g.19733  ORF Transcript_13411/g.19733 Transcript_13411/m.19733 type:complete len:504 (-) Transcript_13411:40-1551(-)|eukprot:CAMPEP_0194031768 /NCGR_PEP_ID=MMETSP0009_2-20130614/4857_1 /TAXON_ID=210454 /ORGANISM="Grammatophora oceanica, Strain CCMP 410" /LENGTH=503 /DNA_ID=CAMNT_0038672001 /DNA_START=268 /DNA_END=1779 /DNA_ORIENTATION=+
MAPSSAMNGDATPSNNNLYDVCIIGGGVVGLGILRAATLQGWKAVVVERKPHIVSSAASAGNSGIVCTGVDATPGTLERALIRDSVSQMRPFLKAMNVPNRPCGSLVCMWEWDEQKATRNHQNGSNNGSKRTSTRHSPLAKVLEESTDAGDTHASILTATQVGNLEPNLSTLCNGAVHIPGEIVLDPWLYSIALASHARENGARIITNFDYDPATSHYDETTELWTVQRKTCKDGAATNNNNTTSEYVPPISLRTRVVVNATGIMADVVQKESLPHRPPMWTAQPRRGQYRIFQADDVTMIRHPIQPVPTQFTKGVFVYSTLYNQIVVGPTAEDQSSRYDRKPNAHVADQLTSHVLRIIPDLRPNDQVVGEYVGIRPGTREHRDYQIYMDGRHNWIVAAGIRSTGLTASLGIGRHVANMLASCLLPAPEPMQHIRTTPLPAVSELVANYHGNKEGLVLINGYLYRVTHPLTILGWKARTGLASLPSPQTRGDEYYYNRRNGKL